MFNAGKEELVPSFLCFVTSGAFCSSSSSLATFPRASPCSFVSQAEKVDEGGWNEPPGFHLIPFPFADDIRSAPIEEGAKGMSSFLSPIRHLLRLS